MADTDNRPPKIFANGVWIRKHEFANGGSILKMSVKADRLIAWLNQHVNEKGYVNIVIQEKRQADEYGTHTASLDTWKPDRTKSAADNVAAQAPEFAPLGEKPDDLPF